MTSRPAHVLIAAAAIAFVVGESRMGFAQTGTMGVSGQGIFESYCATCHGTSGTGDGPLAVSMKVRPADLTKIAQRNGGEFPAAQVAQIIDGRHPVKGHGSGDMPVWGDAFGKSADAMSVDEKIQRLVGYLESIQTKR